MSNITANDHVIKVTLVDDEGITANDHPYKVTLDGTADFATKEDVAGLEEQIAALSTDLTYKGSVDTYEDLTALENPEVGDVYTVKTGDEAGLLYVWDGDSWVPLNETVKLYDATGNNTDGAMTQKATTDMLWLDPDDKRTLAYATYPTGSPSAAPSNARNVVFGASVYARDEASDNVIIGYGAQNSGQSGKNVVIGAGARAWSDYVVAIGYLPYSSTAHREVGSVSIGNNIGATGFEAVAIGGSYVNSGTSSASAAYTGSIAIGTNALASAKGAIAFGYGASATQQGEVNIGATNTSYGYNSSNYRLLSGLYEGQSDHDAVNVAQLNNAVASAGTAFTNAEFNSIFGTTLTEES